MIVQPFCVPTMLLKPKSRGGCRGRKALLQRAQQNNNCLTVSSSSVMIILTYLDYLEHTLMMKYYTFIW